MLVQPAIDGLAGILQREGWVSELAGILPLSALIDFIEMPPKLHIFELAGAVPLWSWVITPAGSRLLLTEQPKSASGACYQDRFGKTIALDTLDGRYGERYLASSPETLRLVLGAHPVVEIDNDHANMEAGYNQDFDMRIQNLEVVHVTRRDPKFNYHLLPSGSLWRQLLVGHRGVTSSPRYIFTILLGWTLLSSTIVMSAILQTWISFAFLLLVPVSGAVVFALYGGRQPRRLLVEKESEFNRLLVVSEQMNSTEWLVVYGESTLVNSLLNRPLQHKLRPSHPSHTPPAVRTAVLFFLLRLFILGQWALALAAAATSDWNAYFICFWIAFSILSHAYLITPQRGAKDWSKYSANLKVERYSTKLSTRRALINTIVALNPDTFSFKNGADGTGAQTPDMTSFYSEGLKWMDPILTRSNNRILWETATREAMMEAAQSQTTAGEVDLATFREHPDGCLSPAWNSTYADPGRCYWRRFIPEGIYVAAKIKREAGLPGQKVRREIVMDSVKTQSLPGVVKNSVKITTLAED